MKIKSTRYNSFIAKCPNSTNMALKARVFISCGQRKNANYLTRITKENMNLMTPELEVAKQISIELKKLGFEPYIALEQQTLQGVKEAIFEKLRKSEYFLFIDFRREALLKEGEINFGTGEYRGSLFSHQELSIATFEGLEVLAFQEEGVKNDDGILKFIQANCKTFSDRKELSSLVASEVRKKWKIPFSNLALDSAIRLAALLTSLRCSLATKSSIKLKIRIIMNIKMLSNPCIGSNANLPKVQQMRNTFFNMINHAKPN